MYKSIKHSASLSWNDTQGEGSGGEVRGDVRAKDEVQLVYAFT